MRKRVVLCGMIAVTVFAGGCGGDGSGPEDVVDDFAEKWLDGDYREACEIVSEEASSAVKLDSAVRGEKPPSPEMKEDNFCPFDLENLKPLPRISGGLEQTVEGGVIDVNESEEVARVDTEAGSWFLFESGGDWVIDKIPFVVDHF